MTTAVKIEQLMQDSGVGFGTSGARGLVSRMTDRVCYAYTAAFIQYLEEAGALRAGTDIAVGGDLRPSTPRIMLAAAAAIRDRGYVCRDCGAVSSPALAYYGLQHAVPTVMVTGSHIPEDRNGIKFNTAGGEILKADEQGIRRQSVELPESRFDSEGQFLRPPSNGLVRGDARGLYRRRYLDYFPTDCLSGMKIGVYQHSAVGRDDMMVVLGGLGADLVPLGRSESFVPVDTEAIRSEDAAAARDWSAEHGLDAIVSTDGDSDRPLVGDENGKWLRGDVAGILCAAYLGADAVVTPVSCNSAVEKCGRFEKVIRTRIGSPYVIEGMQRALDEGFGRVVGYEANGGFLLGSDMGSNGTRLAALPTRDALLLQIAILRQARAQKTTVGRLVAGLPRRYTWSDRLKAFPTERSTALLARLRGDGGGPPHPEIEAAFGDRFGRVEATDETDGLRITFAGGDVVHLRPSGNAPEFRCYNEADSEGRAEEMNRTCLELMDGWRLE